MIQMSEYVNSKRGRTITEEEAKKLLNKTHSNSYNSKIEIYRGVRGYNKYVYIDPSKAAQPRISKNTLNYYTLIMDNSLAWRNFPKRSMSLICTLDKEYADTMGGGVLYRVYPENSSTIGVVPDYDIWMARGQVGKYSWNYKEISMLIRSIAMLNPNVYKNPKTYSEMIQEFELIDKNKKEKDDKIKSSTLIEETEKFWISYMKYDNTFLNFIRELINPKHDDWSIVKSGDNIPKDREVWMSCPCVLVKEE